MRMRARMRARSRPTYELEQQRAHAHTRLLERPARGREDGLDLLVGHELRVLHPAPPAQRCSGAIGAPVRNGATMQRCDDATVPCALMQRALMQRAFLQRTLMQR
jgi:hypothetical protein